MNGSGGKYRRLSDDFDIDAARRRAVRKSILDRQAEEDEIRAVKRKIESSIDSINARREREKEEDFERKIAEAERKAREWEERNKRKATGLDDIIRKREEQEESVRQRELEAQLEKLKRIQEDQRRKKAGGLPAAPAAEPADPNQPPPTTTRRRLPAAKRITFE